MIVLLPTVNTALFFGIPIVPSIKLIVATTLSAESNNRACNFPVTPCVFRLVTVISIAKFCNGSLNERLTAGPTHPLGLLPYEATSNDAPVVLISPPTIPPGNGDPAVNGDQPTKVPKVRLAILSYGLVGISPSSIGLPIMLYSLNWFCSIANVIGSFTSSSNIGSASAVPSFLILK